MPLDIGVGILFALGVAEYLWRGSHICIEAAAWIIAVGAIVTCGTRIFAIARQLKAR